MGWKTPGVEFRHGWVQELTGLHQEFVPAIFQLCVPGCGFLLPGDRNGLLYLFPG